MYHLRTFDWRSAVTHSVVSVHFRDELRDDGMNVVFVRAVLHQCRSEGRTRSKVLDLQNSLNLLFCS